VKQSSARETSARTAPASVKLGVDSSVTTRRPEARALASVQKMASSRRVS
jgi:hypothetical protein